MRAGQLFSKTCPPFHRGEVYTKHIKIRRIVITTYIIRGEHSKKKGLKERVEQAVRMSFYRTTCGNCHFRMSFYRTTCEKAIFKCRSTERHADRATLFQRMPSISSRRGAHKVYENTKNRHEKVYREGVRTVRQKG